MRLSPLATRTRLAGLATCAAAAVLLVQAGAAAAVPSAGSSTAASGPSSTSSTSTSATSGSVTTGASAPAARPKAVAPPAGPGPACTTNQTALNPVVCLPAGSGEDKPASLTRGDDTEFDAQIVNNGPAVSHASVVITLPKGLILEPDEGLDDAVYRIDDWYVDDGDGGDYTSLTCTGGPATITCDVGALGTGANILVGIDLEVSEDATPGSTLDFGVALTPVAPDTYPATSIAASIVVLKPTHLVVSLAPAGLHTVVGHRATITGTVRNAGTDPAPATVAVALDENPKHPKQTHFVITNGHQFPVDDPSDDPTDGSGEDSASAAPVAITGLAHGLRTAVLATRDGSRVRSLLQRHALGRPAASVTRHSLPTVAFWPIGTLAPGAVAHVTIQLKAVTLGTDTLTFGAISGEQECSGFGDESGSSSAPAAPTVATVARAAAASTTTAPADCSFIVQTKITAVPAAAPLANSGTHGLDVQVGIAVWAVVLGALLVWLGRRRTVVGGPRH